MTIQHVVMRGHWYCGRCDKKFPPGRRYNILSFVGVCEDCLIAALNTEPPTRQRQQTKSGFIEIEEQAARETPEPTYASIHSLERLVRAWLDGLLEISRAKALGAIKARTSNGKKYLDQISAYINQRHDDAHRLGDLRQACNNVLAQERSRDDLKE